MEKINKQDIEDLIEKRKEDSFTIHLWNIISRDFSSTGEVGWNKIKIWKQSVWNSVFYPIFCFEFENNQLKRISYKLNPVGKILFGLLIMVYLLIVSPNNLAEFEISENLLGILIAPTFLVILFVVLRKIYTFERQNQLDEIYAVLNIEIKNKTPQKEWSLKNILIRLFTYPFSLFLIGINLTLIIPNRQYFLAFGIFGFVAFYLIADLMMIFKKKTTGNNGQNA